MADTVNLTNMTVNLTAINVPELIDSIYPTGEYNQTALSLFKALMNNVTQGALHSIPGGDQAISTKLDNLVSDVNTMFVFVCALLVLSMQLGFALVEAGSVQANLRSILMKNIFDVCLCTCTWLVIGYGVAAGRHDLGGVFAIDHPFYLPSGEGGTLIEWFFGLSFVATSSTIVSGSMAERTKYLCYVVYTICMSAFIYPVVSQWVWGANGWMSAGNENAVIPLLDFAGCGVVHMTGGISGLVGAKLVGPRPGIFGESEPIIYSRKEEIVRERLKSTQLLFCVIGTMILWIGWYGFNCGSELAIVDATATIARVAINTTVSAVAGAVTATVVSYAHLRLFLLDKVLMGILAGLVSITAAAPWVHPGLAVASGFIGFFFYYGAELVLYKLKIDDPVAAFPVHGCCGVWGLISTGLFQEKENTPYGPQLGYQIAGALIIVIWSLLCSFVVFYLLKVALGGSIRMLNVESEFKMLEEENPRVGPLGDVTLVFTDIQGSTSLWESDAEAMAEALVLHDSCIRRLIKKHSGFEVKTEGDAFMVAFGDSLDALRFCVECQKELMKIDWPKHIYTCKCARIEESDDGDIVFKGVRIRMGYHTGQPAGKENPVTLRTDYFGRDVNYAARVSSAGAGGQVLISSEAVRAMFPFYSDPVKVLEVAPPFGMQPGFTYPFEKLGCSVEYLGKYHLKGINLDPAGECLYQVNPFGFEGRVFPPLKVDEGLPGAPTSAGKRNTLTPKQEESEDGGDVDQSELSPMLHDV